VSTSATTTFGQTLEDLCRALPGRTAVVVDERSLTFAELHHEAAQVAAGLAGLGVSRGDPIAIWADNSLEWMITYWAVAGMGATLVPLNTRFRGHELAHCLGLTRCKALIVGPGVATARFPEIVREVVGAPRDGVVASERFPDLKLVIEVAEEVDDGFLSWQDLPRGQVIDRWEGRSDDVAYIQFTSGTTGTPKGVALQAGQMFENARQVGDRMLMTAATRVVFPGPLYHVLGSVLATLAPVARGGSVVLTRSFDAQRTLAQIESLRCTVHFGLETMLIEELAVQREESFDLSSLRTGMMAGSPALFRAVSEELHIPGLIMGFGMSETTASAATTLPADPVEVRMTTVGRPLEGCEIRVVDPEAGSPCAVGEQGEICLRGGNIFHHYFNDPAATAAAFDAEGWFHSGDAGCFDSDGRLIFRGRMGETIRVGGENVSPVEVETLIAEHPAVKLVQVVAAPDQRLQQVPVAFVETVDGEAVPEEELIDWCRGKLASFKLPRQVIAISDWPLTGTGRIRRQALRDICKQRDRRGDLIDARS
jgi:fatty-acyl-CoA synthase